MSFLFQVKSGGEGRRWSFVNYMDIEVNISSCICLCLFVNCHTVFNSPKKKKNFGHTQMNKKIYGLKDVVIPAVHLVGLVIVLICPPHYKK